MTHQQFASTLPKPRLVRQEAVQEEEDTSPPRLGVRFLPTIPSAADSSIIMEDGDSGLMPSITGLYNNLQTATQLAKTSPRNTSALCMHLKAAKSATGSSSIASTQLKQPSKQQTETEPLPLPQDKPP